MCHDTEKRFVVGTGPSIERDVNVRFCRCKMRSNYHAILVICVHYPTSESFSSRQQRTGLKRKDCRQESLESRAVDLLKCLMISKYPTYECLPDKVAVGT